MRFLLFFLLIPLMLGAQTVPRRLIGFWDSRTDGSPDSCLIHRTLEMPLNHLGYDVLYYDIQKPLPDIAQQADVAGILLCFAIENASMPDPTAFIEWAMKAIDAGKKVVIMRNPGFLTNLNGDFTPEEIQNRLFDKIGMTNTQKWIDYPFDYKILSKDPELFPFERDFAKPLDGFYITRAVEGKSYLKIGMPGKPESESDLIIITPHGAYVSQSYAFNYDFNSPQDMGWYFNPFRFFELVFGKSSHPIPDITTLAGRRIFYSKCDGDAWNQDTAIEQYRGKEVNCAQVILEKVIKPNPDIPIAVGVIAATVNPAWAAKKNSQEIARQYWNLTQVESASHTYSHPFDWEFFRSGQPEKEAPFLHLYPNGSWGSGIYSWLKSKSFEIYNPEEFKRERLKWGYALPRAYANEPFNLKEEIVGAVKYLDQFAPKDNKVDLLLWSGDGLPWAAAEEMAYKAGLKTHGGGFVRYDRMYPSVLGIYPIGRKPGGWIQPYNSANAEINYTDGWKDNFFGLQFLIDTLKNTGYPLRLRPMFLYFHSFSGEFQSSVNAILKNIEFIRTQTYIPIEVGRFCDTVLGFYKMKIEPLGEARWKIRDRNGMQTVRFDRADDKSIDFLNSAGVIGSNRYQGSLYVYLDAAVKEPVVAIKSGVENSGPYLIDSSWELWNLKHEGKGLSFTTKGIGKLAMRWKMAQGGTYTVVTSKDLAKANFSADQDNILTVELDLPYKQQIDITLSLSTQ